MLFAHKAFTLLDIKTSTKEQITKMQHRRNFLIQGSLALGAAVFAKPLKGFSIDRSLMGTKSTRIITILHTSDLHITESPTTDAISKNLQSITRTVNVVRKDSPNTVLLHNGNFYNSPHDVNKNYTDNAKSLEKLGYDAIVFGQKDILHGEAVCNNLLDRDHHCIIDSLGNNNIPGLKPLNYKIIEKGSLKIGVISNPAGNNSSTQTIEATATALSKIADHLKNEHQCALVVCMSTANINFPNTSPLKKDIELASLTTNVDIIISGNNEVKCPVNYVCHNTEKQEVIVHASSFLGSSVGRIDIELCSKLQKKHVKVYYNNSLI